jgi:hypothetical protein
MNTPTSNIYHFPVGDLSHIQRLRVTVVMATVVKDEEGNDYPVIAVESGGFHFMLSPPHDFEFDVGDEIILERPGVEGGEA